LADVVTPSFVLKESYDLYILMYATKLDFALRRLETIVDKYCIEGKEDMQLSGNLGMEYAHDFRKDDIAEAIRLVKQQKI